MFSSPDPDRIEEKRKRKGDWLNRVMPSSGTGIVLNLHHVLNEHTPLVWAGEIKGGGVGGDGRLVRVWSDSVVGWVKVGARLPVYK